MQIPEPQSEHKWLQQLVGEWAFEHAMPAEDGKEPQVYRGREIVRAMGDLWVLCEGTGDVPGGGTSRSLFTFGYDPHKQKFVGSFIAAIMTHQWLYEGTLDRATNTLILDTTGPDFADPSVTKPYRDSIQIVSPSERILTSSMPGDDGTWNTFMTASYKRI